MDPTSSDPTSSDPDDLAARRRLVRRTFDAFSRRDLAALSGLVCEDVEFWGPTAREVGRAEPYRGLDGLAVYLRDVATVWEELRLSPGTFQSRGDEIAVVGRTYAWGGGRVVDAPASWAFRLRGGRIASLRAFDTRDGGPLAVGVQCAEEDSNLHGP